MLDTTQGLEWATKAFADADQQRYQKYYDYMRGDHPLEFASPKFRSAFGRAFQAFAYNRMPMVVDAIADRMQITGFGSTPEGLAKDWQAVWDANNMDVRSGQVEREQFTAGESYVIVEMDPDSGDVLIWPQAAHSVRVHYADDRPGHINCAVKRWRDQEGYDRLTVYYPDRMEKYRSRNARPSFATHDAAGDVSTYTTTWEPYQPEGDSAWPLPLSVNDTVPVFHFANNAGVDNRGQSELADVIPIQDALNKSLMDLLVAMEFASFPQRYVVNLDMNDEKTAESVDRVMSGIDRVLELYGDNVSAGEFTAANIAQYTQVVELFDTMISRVSKVPVHYLQMSGDFGSGEARRLAEIPFVAKVDDRILADTPVWSDVARYGLRLMGRNVEPGQIKVNWAPTAALSEEEQFRLAHEKLAAGWSQQAVMREIGRDNDEIAKIMAEKETERAAVERFLDAGGLNPDPTDEV